MFFAPPPLFREASAVILLLNLTANREDDGVGAPCGPRFDIYLFVLFVVKVFFIFDAAKMTFFVFLLLTLLYDIIR